jgi:hypothetical protein
LNPIRTDDEIEVLTIDEIRMEQMKLEALREDGQVKQNPKEPITQH